MTKRHEARETSEGAGGAGSARDREMGRADEPLGDLGGGRETWTPPAGEQGISNRPDDGGVESADAGGDDQDDLEEGLADGLDDTDDDGDGFEDDDEPTR